MDNRQLTAESVNVFREGIDLVLSRWSALQMAVENEWGGRESRRKAELLASDVLSFFTNNKELDVVDLEYILEDSLLSLNTQAEDGSIEEVADNLMIMYDECLEGNYQSVEKLRASNPPPVAHVRQVNDEDDDEDDDDEDDEEDDDDNNVDMEVDVPKPQSNSNPVRTSIVEPKPVAEAEDGWVQVSSRRNRGQRNN